MRSLTTAASLHLQHVLGEGQGQLDDLEDGIAHALEWLDASGEGKEEDVEPGNEEADWPAKEDES